MGSIRCSSSYSIHLSRTQVAFAMQGVVKADHIHHCSMKYIRFGIIAATKVMGVSKIISKQHSAIVTAQVT